MNHLDEAKLLSALLGVLKKESSKVRDGLLEELRTELQKDIEDQSGVKYLQLEEIDNLENPIPIRVFRGDKGPRGITGAKGAKGETGTRGLRGAAGPQGLQGKIGPIGSTGPQGVRGQDGPVGPAGVDGVDGATPDIKPVEDKLLNLLNDFKGSISAQVTRMAYAKGSLGSGSGSGEVRLLRLDDVDDTNLSDGKELRYNASIGKFEFVTPFNPNATGHLIPSANNTFDLGSEDRQWRDLYLSGQSLFINGTPAMQQDANTGNIILATNTVVRVANNSTLPVAVNEVDKETGVIIPNATVLDLNNYLQVANANILLSSKADTTDLAQYLQVANVSSLITTQLDTLVDGAPGALDTLNELAAALGDDENFAGTITSSLSTKVSNTHFNSQLSTKADASDLTNYLQVANNFSGVYNDLIGKPNLDVYASNTALALKADSTDLNQYVQVANVDVLVSTSVNNIIDGAPAALDTLNEIAAALGDDANFATTITTSIADKASNTYVNTQLSSKADTLDLNNYLQVANSFSGVYSDLISTPNLDVYASNSSVVSALSLKADTTDLSQYLLVANAVSSNVITSYDDLAGRPNLDQYLQVANNFSGAYGDLTGTPNLDIYASNTALTLKADATALSDYLQVANNFSGAYNDLTNRPNLDVYAANSALTLKADASDLTNYLQVANSFSESYNDLTDRPNLDLYAANSSVNSSLALKANTADLAQYVQLANVNSLIATSVSSLIDGAPGALDTLNEIAAALGDDENFATTITTSIAAKASNTYVNTQLSNKADTSALDGYLQVANNFSGLYNDLTDRPNLDVYASNTNLTLKADSTDLTQYLQVANVSGISIDYSNLTSTPNLDIYAANNALALKADSSDLSNYLQVANNKAVVAGDNITISTNSTSILVTGTTPPVNLDPYLQVANVSSLITAQIDTLVDSAPGTLDTLNELAAALGDDENFAGTIVSSLGAKASNTYVNTQLSAKADSTDLNQYLQVANTFSESYNDLTDKPNLDIYASNTSVTSLLSNKADRSELSDYLQVANNFSGVYSDLTDKPNLDIYASNTALSLKADSTDLNQYLQVANTFSGVYSDLTGKPNLDVYASNTALSLKADTTSLDGYLQVANVNSLITTQIDNLVDSAPGALDTLNELAAALGDDSDFATTITTSLAGKASNTYVISQLSTKADATQLTNYLQVANSINFATTTDLNQYAQVANTFSGLYSDLSGAPNLDLYASNTALSSKVDTSQLSSYLNVANTAGTGTSLVESKINNIINLRSLRAGPNITLTESDGEITIAATDTMDFGFVNNDFGSIAEAADIDPQFDFGTL